MNSHCHERWCSLLISQIHPLLFSSLLCGSGDWPLQRSPGLISQAPWPSGILLGSANGRYHRSWSHRRENSESQLTGSQAPSASVWFPSWLWPSMVTVSLGQPFIHSSNSQVNLQVVTITHCIGTLQNSVGPFHLGPISVKSCFSSIPAESIIRFLLWH